MSKWNPKYKRYRYSTEFSIPLSTRYYQSSKTKQISSETNNEVSVIINTKVTKNKYNICI